MAGWIDAHAAWLFLLLVLPALGALRHRHVRRGLRPAGAGAAAPPLPRALRRDALAAAACAGAAGFALLAWSVSREAAGNPLPRWDHGVAALMRSHVGLEVLQVLGVFTGLGSAGFMAVAAAAVALVLLARRDWLMAQVWTVGVAGNGLLIRAFKQAVERARPAHAQGVVVETGFSFPSGHAAGTVVLYGLLAYLLMLRLAPRWHRPVAAGAGLLVLAIGASRVALQVHYLSDVVAGFLLGLTWLVLVVGTAEHARRW
jgi:membrane-associated phospholipid phosphatase